MATLLDESADELVLSHQEMIKGVNGHRFDEKLVLPIIENTPRESNLADLLASAIEVCFIFIFIKTNFLYICTYYVHTHFDPIILDCSNECY
jgi:hypothetical protein